MSIVISIFIFLLILTITITVHELGHFLTAKKFGVYCREFAIGMGKKIFERKKGETTFAIRLVPMGGFVQMIGEDGEIDNSLNPGDTLWIHLNKSGTVDAIYEIEPENIVTKKIELVTFSNEEQPIVLSYYEDGELIHVTCENLINFYDKENYEQWVVAKNRQFTNIKPWKKIIVLAAGATMNFIFALLFIFMSTWINGVSVDPIIENDMYPTISEAFKQNDEIIAINGQQMKLQEITAYVQANPNKTVVVEVERQGEVVPVKRVIQEQTRQDITKDGVQTTTYGALGIRYKANHTNLGAIFKATIATFVGIFESVIFTFVSLFSGKVSPTNLTGFIGIAQQTNAIISVPTIATSVWSKGAEISARLLSFSAFLGINIGALNLLPFPALDGGRIVFALYEMIFRRKPSAKVEMYFNAAGFIVLIGLFVMVTFMDVGRLFSR